MVPEILQHIERLQAALASADPYGRSATVAVAVAQIAAELRGSARENGEAGHTDSPVFMQ